MCGSGDEVDTLLDIDVHTVFDMTHITVESTGYVIDATVFLRFATEETQTTAECHYCERLFHLDTGDAVVSDIYDI